MRKLLLVIFLFSSLAWGQIYNTSVSRATGKAGRAAVDPGEVSLMNPATLVHLKDRSLMYSQGEDVFAVALAENSFDVVMPASLAYVRKQNKSTEVLMEDARVTLADHWYSGWSFGLTGHQYKVRVVDENFQQTNVDAGLMYTPTSRLGLALMVHDGLPDNIDIPEAYRLRSRTGIGANYLYGTSVRFRVDALSAINNNFNYPTTMVGYEAYLNRWLVFRLGYRHEQLPVIEYASVGAGLDLPRFDINYAYEGEVKESQNHTHSIDLTVTF